ncbi:MAG: hypothetical protein G01um10148_409 [Parcubacteria group bacterium Gr01-1014_8]|nr:MAG: hypothetical protein G01um10148_409 [Parcubacteria group bacterium Gr01-1014_8]
MYELSLWSILGSALSSVVLAFIWYNPKVFGTAWMRLSNISPEAAERGKRRMPIMAFFAFLASMIVAYVMTHFGIAWGVFDWIGGFELGFWLWLGFAAPVLLGSVLWEGKSFKLYAINAGYWLISLILMGVILSF